MVLIVSKIVRLVELALDNLQEELLDSRGSSKSISTVGTIVGAHMANDVSSQRQQNRNGRLTCTQTGA